MNETPRLLRKKASLSLNKLKAKRHSASPQNIAQVESPTLIKTPRRLSTVSIDGGYDFTPPHRNINLNESLESSPGLFDTSFSSNCFLSQTLGSPEVGWRWEKKPKLSDIEPTGNTTPDSAYAADSSLSSNSSSSCRLTRETVKRLRILDANRREEQRRLDELKIRKEEKVRATEALRKRCAILQEQLDDDSKIVARTLDKENLNNNKEEVVNNEINVNYNKLNNCKTSIETNQSVKTPKNSRDFEFGNQPSSSRKRKCLEEPNVKNNDSISDFFNDDETDCFLLEATQSLESKIVELSQKSAASITEVKDNVDKSCNDKRSSLYLQFLEDETPDDWFESLDEVIAEATQTKNPRSLFQRYNSMPEPTTAATSNTITNNSSTATTKKISNSVNQKTDSRSGTKFKKYSSTHAFGPTTSNYGGRQQPMRK